MSINRSTAWLAGQDGHGHCVVAVTKPSFTTRSIGWLPTGSGAVAMTPEASGTPVPFQARGMQGIAIGSDERERRGWRGV